MPKKSSSSLVQDMLNGDSFALSRLISLAEDGSEEIPDIMQTIYPQLGKAHRIGITGPPGVGKSTLVDKLTTVMRNENLTIAIIAVDPSSPFSGGALLGDRIRMRQHYLDQGVFIRSMSTRGSIGGLPAAINGVLDLVDAAGKSTILIETVGVGQSELEIMNCADTIIVVLSPDAGDSIQVMKAGLLEIADLFVVNKSDQPGADILVTEIQMMLEHGTRPDGWQVPVVTSQAIHNMGIDELCRHVQLHYEVQKETGQLAQRRGRQRLKQFTNILKLKVLQQLKSALSRDKRLGDYVYRVERGEIDPYSATAEVFKSKIISLVSLDKYYGS